MAMVKHWSTSVPLKFQWKYRIECTELLAATQGLYGQRIAKDATWKGRAEGLKGNYTAQSLNLVARY